MEDREIIRLFFERNDSAIESINQKYGRLCRGIAQNILGNTEDAEECVNDAYLGAWNTIPPNSPDILSAYLLKIVKNISIKRYYSENAKKRGGNYRLVDKEIEEILKSSNLPENEIEAKELTQIINTFLSSMQKENRIIFMKRYWFCDSYAEISKSMGISEKNVSVRLSRIRKELKQQLIREGVIL